jgi:hypothetical protein
MDFPKRQALGYFHDSGCVLTRLLHLDCLAQLYWFRGAALEYFSPGEKYSASIFTSNFNHLTGIWRFQSDDYCS